MRNFTTLIKEQEAVTDTETKKISEKIAELKGRTSRIDALQQEILLILKETQRLPQAENELTTLENQLKTVEDKGRDSNSCIDIAANEIERLTKSISEAEEKLAFLDKGETKECPLCKSPLGTDGHQHLRDSLQSDLLQCREELQSKTTLKKQLENEREILRKNYKLLQTNTKKQQETISALRSRQHQIETCETELAALQVLQAELDQWQELLKSGDYAQEARQKIQETQKKLLTLDYSPEAHALLLKNYQNSQKDESLWERLQEESRRTVLYTTRYLVLEQEITGMEQTLKSEDFAKNDILKCLDLTNRTKPLEAELAKRKPLLAEQNLLRNAVSEKNQLIHAENKLPDITSEIAALVTQTEAIQNRLRQISENRQTMLPQLQETEETQTQLNTRIKEITLLENERAEWHKQIGSIQGELARLEKRQTEMQEIIEKRHILARDERQYDILRKAFSRDGIPAMIIEQVLPELENDANRLLQYLTNGACSIKLESQREKKSGGMTETLDIKISDEMGTRDYEMFSGGEAFRTDLALRIALSQLLCRRAGSKLQTLIIDEGFGTQDSEGLFHIVEAMNDIQDEFEKILIVTHLDEMKEKFLTRIEVFKEPGIGSRFEVFYTA